MIDREKVIKVLNHFTEERICLPNLIPWVEIAEAVELLKEQEESIPVSWLKEKLEGHPELPYAVTDGISNVLDLWEGR